MNRQADRQISGYIFASWRNWAISVGLVYVLVVVSPWLSRMVVPYIAFGMSLVAFGYCFMRHRERYQALAVPYICAITLLLAGVIMTALNLIDSITDLYELAGKQVNKELPFIVQLFVSPLFAITSGIYLLHRIKTHNSYRTATGRSVSNVMQRLVWQESRYQVRFLFIMATVIAVVEWAYCFTGFVTASFNDTDMFFFVWLPVIVFVLSLGTIGVRCISLWAYYSQRGAATMINRDTVSVVRYIIISDDTVYLKEHTIDIKHERVKYYDTALRVRHEFINTISDSDAMQLFTKYTGIEEVKGIKFLYKDDDVALGSNIFHFLIVLNTKEEIDDSRIRTGEWLTLNELRSLDHQHRLGAELSAELVHIYTVGMMYKTYDRDGRRLYPIRHYRPTFRLGEILGWDVDFSDPRWFKIARLNADKSFFAVRRLFQMLGDAMMR